MIIPCYKAFIIHCARILRVVPAQLVHLRDHFVYLVETEDCNAEVQEVIGQGLHHEEVIHFRIASADLEVVAIYFEQHEIYVFEENAYCEEEKTDPDQRFCKFTFYDI